MRKRLRKKRRLQEFTQLAFLAKAQVNQGLPEMAREALLDRFLLEAIEGNDLSCGGGCGPWEWDLVVCANGRRSASENDRERVLLIDVLGSFAARGGAGLRARCPARIAAILL